MTHLKYEILAHTFMGASGLIPFTNVDATNLKLPLRARLQIRLLADMSVSLRAARGVPVDVPVHVHA